VALAPGAAYSAHSLLLVAAAPLAPASLAACNTPRAVLAQVVVLAVYSLPLEPHKLAACRSEFVVAVAYILALPVGALVLAAYMLPWALAEREVQVAAQPAELRPS
jgi:hypothetical protein